MKKSCSEDFLDFLGVIINLRQDLLDETKAIEQYEKHIEILKALGTDPMLDSVFLSSKLREIADEERHHHAELDEYVREFSIADALEDYANCECAARGDQAAASAKISEFKIKGRDPRK
jgi:rubrerythrin